MYLLKSETSSASVAIATRIPGMNWPMLLTVTCVSLRKNALLVRKAHIWPRLIPVTNGSLAGLDEVASSVKVTLSVLKECGRRALRDVTRTFTHDWHRKECTEQRKQWTVWGAPRQVQNAVER